ncbi:NPCBM/NEW2 domain-containing protein [Flammeovirga aprica]|uniref:Prolyl oligopeptidase family serine peptidase n=1 Tax=Flammeovirga aprica JL-4 TaxID=694437 RepID=A0A7X9RXU5_9BACT|nr:NPCBM/NEW2 domain-containing protein [Flammeovirga aprica]NME70742.1 prolyl oligopeptidase family serine peptidase [Flammeovirga aprica JL-4]
MKYFLNIMTVLLLMIGSNGYAQLTPVELWKDFDPDKGDFKEEIIKEEVIEGIYYKDSYISAYVNGEEVRVYCKYAVKEGVKNAPALLDVHGWMSKPNIDMKYVKDGWAVLAHDYCGKTGERPHYTKYPESLKYGNIDKKEGYRIKNKLPDGSYVTDPKQTDDYLWYVLQRRALSYLMKQKEVDTKKVGAKGYSYGGTLMWNLGMDKRIKAFVAYFGIGYLEYWRSKQVWLYNKPYKESAQDPGEKLYLSCIAPQSYAPYIKVPALWLSGTNDHHGGHERSEHIFKSFSKNVPWDFALQARGHHNTEKLGDDAKVWLEKHVIGTKHFWPQRPVSGITLDAKGIPSYKITPANIDKVKEVKVYYALKNPVSYTRVWRDTEVKREGNSWVASLPVMNVDDYVFAYANVYYEGNIVISGDFEAKVPSELGNAIATDEPSNDLGSELWSNTAPVEGAGGIMALRPFNRRGITNESFSDPRYVAPQGANFNFLFYCTQPQSLLLKVNDRFEYNLEITASNDWQQMEISADQVLNIHNNQPLGQWSKATKVQIVPKAGADITKVLFSNTSWEKKSIEDVKAEGEKALEAKEIKGKRMYLTSKNASEVDSYWRVNDNSDVTGEPLTLQGKAFDRGLGVHAPSRITYKIEEGYKHFYATAAASESHHGYLQMRVLLDGKEVYNSGEIKSDAQEPKPFDIDLQGAKTLTLLVSDLGSKGGDHANWLDPFFIVDESVEVKDDYVKKEAKAEVNVPTATHLTKKSPASVLLKGERIYITKDMASSTDSYWRVMENQSIVGEKISIKGTQYDRGLGVHSDSKIKFPIEDNYKAFVVTPGANDSHNGILSMSILVDGLEVYNSGPIKSKIQVPEQLLIDVATKSELTLIVEQEDGNNGGDHASWAEAFFLLSGDSK